MRSKNAGWRAILLSLVVAAASLVVSTGVTVGSSSAASAATVSTNGTWPGVGKICGSGSGGASSTRGVSSNSINIATFGDPGNTVQPGLDIEFFQAAGAFAKWCNAAGGINGRKVVVHNRDAALFNAAQVTNQACQQDFMSVGGGMALDQPSVQVRVACGLGQITGFTVSDAAVGAPLQVNPAGTNNSIISAGWYGALAKKYPKAVKAFGTGGQNTQSILEPEQKWRLAAEAQGYKTLDFQEPPLTVTDWKPYVEQAQSKGVQALQPSDDSDITPYVQAMNTVGYNPAFMLLTTQFYASATVKAAAQAQFPTTYTAIQYWPFELASQSPGLQQLQSIMHKYAGGDTIDWSDELAINSWVLFAKSATACGANLTVSCVLKNAAAQKNWTGGGLTAPVAQLAMSDNNPIPSACFLLMTVKPNKFVYNKAVTNPNSGIWNCDPKGLIHLPTSTGG
jgi:ABC-type branched-subunit amino acid transport system substrate-binding protein